jgi:hypothetical protein
MPSAHGRRRKSQSSQSIPNIEFSRQNSQIQLATIQSRSSLNSRKTLIHSQQSAGERQERHRVPKAFQEVISEQDQEHEELKEGGQEDETPQEPPRN